MEWRTALCASQNAINQGLAADCWSLAQQSLSQELPYSYFHFSGSLERNFKRKPFLHDDKMHDKVHWWEKMLKYLLVIHVHKHLTSSMIYKRKQRCILMPHCF